MEKCPKCGDDYGYFSKMRTSYTQLYDWDGNPVDACDGLTFGGKRKRCGKCKKDVTKYVDNS